MDPDFLAVLWYWKRRSVHLLGQRTYPTVSIWLRGKLSEPVEYSSQAVFYSLSNVIIFRSFIPLSYMYVKVHVNLPG